MSDFEELFTEPPKEVSGFNKEEWAKKKNADKEAAFALIEEAASSLNTPEALGTYLDVAARFDMYSVSNLLLIANQMPDATKLADSKTWSEKNIYIKKGEKAIMLIEPGKEYTKSDGTTGKSFSAKKVFDISQTSAKVTPPEVKMPDARQLLSELVKSCKVSMFRDDDLPDGVNAKYDAQKKVINVRPGTSPEVTFAAVTKELAFAKLDSSDEHRDENKLKAYCVSYILCKRAGIEPAPMRGHGNPFAGKDSKAVKAELSSIRNVANDISSLIFPQKKKEKVRDNDAR